MVGVLGSANASTAATPQPLRSTEGQGIAQARAILARLGVDQRQITMTLRPGAKPSYHIRIRNGHVSAEGTSQIALVHGVTQVLQRQGRFSLSWEGKRIAPSPICPPMTVAR
jgi:hypothetical protein